MGLLHRLPCPGNLPIMAPAGPEGAVNGGFLAYRARHQTLCAALQSASTVNVLCMSPNSFYGQPLDWFWNKLTLSEICS